MGKILAIIFLGIILQGCGSNVASIPDLSSPSSSIATTAPIPVTPVVKSDDQLPVVQNADGTFTRQSLSFFTTDSTSSLGPPVTYTGTSN